MNDTVHTGPSPAPCLTQDGGYACCNASRALQCGCSRPRPPLSWPATFRALSLPGPSISRGKSASPFLPISDDDRALAFILNSLALSLSVPLKPDFVYVPVHGSLYKTMLCVSSRRSKRSLFPVFQHSLFFTLSLKSYTICLK